MRTGVVVAVACALLAGAAPARAADRVVERGIVQAIDRETVVLLAFDVTQVSVPLGAEARFRVNVRDAALGEIRIGFVAEAVLDSAGNTVVLRAFGTPVRRVVRGVLVRLRLAAVVLRRPSGRTARVPLTAATTVWRNAGRIRLRALRPGMLLEIERGADGTAATIVVLRRG